MNNTLELKERIKKTESLLNKTTNDIKELDAMIDKLKAFMKESDEKYYLYRPYIIKAFNLRCEYIYAKNKCVDTYELLVKELEKLK